MIISYSMKIAFITGITGQDGSYLAELLLSKGYVVYGSVRRTSLLYVYTRLDHIRNRINLIYGDMTDSPNIMNTLINITKNGHDIKVFEIYNLAAQSHVGISFEMPEYTSDVDGIGTLRLLEAIRTMKQLTKINIRFYQAGTSELYGCTKTRELQDINAKFDPVSPYAAAKLYAFHMTKIYRDAYDIYAVNGILFNHESPRRGENFVTMKIVNGARDIINGKRKVLKLGNLDSSRDWGHAKDYVEGMWRMLQNEKPKDYVLATGETRTVREFASIVFAKLNKPITWVGRGLDEKGTDSLGNILISVDPKYFRPNEVPFLKGDPSVAEMELNWKRHFSFEDLVHDMMSLDDPVRQSSVNSSLRK